MAHRDETITVSSRSADADARRAKAIAALGDVLLAVGIGIYVSLAIAIFSEAGAAGSVSDWTNAVTLTLSSTAAAIGSGFKIYFADRTEPHRIWLLIVPALVTFVSLAAFAWYLVFAFGQVATPAWALVSVSVGGLVVFWAGSFAGGGKWSSS